MLEKIQILIFSSDLKSRQDDRGATAVEYSMMVALIAAVIAAIVTVLGTDLQVVFQAAADMFP